MKIITLLLIAIALSACSEKTVEEFTFRKTLEYHLTDLCGKEDVGCITAVKEQIQGCMEKSDWYKYLKDQDNKAETERFTTEFYACIVDPDGDPYFANNAATGTD